MEPVTPDVRPLSLSAFRDRHRGETIIVCGCGRSLNDLPEPAHYVTIGVNDVGRRFDPTYLVVVNPPGQFTGGRFRHVAESRARFLFTCRDDLGAVRPDLVRFPLGRFGGTDFDQPDVLHYAQNSPYVALCLAARMGAARIGLIGVDFTEDHFFAQTGPHPLAAQLTTIDRQYAALGHALRPRGVTVVNLSAQSRLTAFPKVAVGDFLARVPTTRALDIVSYATTPVAGVPAILARCIASVTPHKARCVWARDDYGNGVAFDGDVEWNRSPVEAERLIDAADLVIVHNGKVDPAHRRLFARKPVVTMAHNYIWNVDCGFVDAGFPGVVVGQYQATLPEFSGWSVVPNPIPLWEPAYQPDVKPDVVTIAYTPSGRHESFPPGHKLWWHAKGYDTTMRVLHRLAERHAIRLRVIGDKQISHASALAMKRGAHIVIDECVTGSYHRNSLEGLATGAIVINGVGLRPEIGDMLRICSGGAELPFGFATLETLEQELERLICLGAPALTQRGAAARLWMERHWQFATQWERNWQPMLDAALARSAGRALIPPSIERPVSIVIPHGGRERLDLLGMTLTAAARCGAVAEIIVAEMDDAPHARDLVQHLGYSHVFIRRDAGFNKARAINVATELAVGELVLWLDNDLLLPDGFLDRAVAELRRRDLDCLIPWTSVHYLNSDDSSALVAGTKRLEQCRPVNAYHTRSGACGGAVLLRRRLVRDFGGMCEAFRGWGGEDNAWFHKARVVGKAAITARADQHLHHLFHPLSGGYGTPEHIAANPHYQANVALLYEMRRVTDRARFMASWPPPERAPCPWDREKTIALVAEPGDVWVQERSSTVRTSLHERYGIQATEQTPCNDPNADAVIFFRSGDAPCEVRDQPFRARSVVVRRTRVGIAPERDTAYHLDGDHPDFARALIAPLSVILGTHAPPRAAAQVCVGAGTALVAAASGIGDLIRVTPLIRVLARLGHRVDFLIAPDYPDSAELFRGAPEINRVIMHPPLTARAPPRQIAELAGVNYESAIFGYLAAAFAPGVAATDRHVVDRERWLTEGDSKCAERIARELGWREAMPAPIAVASSRRFDLPDGTVVLHPGCKRNWPWKRWHGFADLAAMLPEVAIVGTEEDRTNAGTYFGDRHAWPAHVRDYTGTLSLPDTAALIGQAAAVVSNDSGLMHLAVAVGTPTFGVFGITNPAREIIPAPHMHVVTKGLPCEAPCRGQPQGRRDCEHHLRCLKQLTAAEVIESMNHLLPVQRPVMPVPRRPAANIDTVEVLTIAIQIEGGLGDIMIAASFVEALWLTLGRCVIDVFHQTPDWAKFVFHDTRFVRNVLPAASHRVTSARYDIAAYLPQYVHYRVHDWPKLERLNPGAANMIRVANERFEQHRGLFDRRPNLDGLWGRLSVASGRTVFTNLGYLGGIASADRLLRYLAPDPSACEPAMRLIGADGDRYVTVHDGFDTTQKVAAGTATKCWPIDKWNDFVARFKAAFPAVRVVQVGAGKSRPIGGVDVNLLGRTSLHQVAWLLKHAALHIDTDSGLVHLAHAMHTRSIALFGPTDKEFYGYAGNGNLGGEVCGKCWWSTPDWLARCPRGLKQPECMTSIAPEQVLDEARRMLGTHRPAAWQLVARKLYDTVPEQAEGSILHSMFAGLTLPSVPITRHAIEPDSGIYMHASKQWEYPWVLGQIASLGETRGPLTTADIGGGRGALAPYLAKLGHRVEVFDRDYLWDHGGDTGVEARYRLWAAAQGYTARFGSLYNLPAEDAAYDVVVSVSVVEHVQHKHQAMSELLRLVKPGGLLILTFDFAREPARFQDGSRLEIFGPELLATTLSGFGIGSPDFNDAEIAESASAIQRDGVLGIPAGMTVGGIAIRTECEQ